MKGHPHHPITIDIIEFSLTWESSRTQRTLRFVSGFVSTFQCWCTIVLFDHNVLTNSAICKISWCMSSCYRTFTHLPKPIALGSYLILSLTYRFVYKFITSIQDWYFSLRLSDSLQNTSNSIVTAYRNHQYLVLHIMVSAIFHFITFGFRPFLSCYSPRFCTWCLSSFSFIVMLPGTSFRCGLVTLWTTWWILSLPFHTFPWIIWLSPTVSINS